MCEFTRKSRTTFAEESLLNVLRRRFSKQTPFMIIPQKPGSIFQEVQHAHSCIFLILLETSFSRFRNFLITSASNSTQHWFYTVSCLYFLLTAAICLCILFHLFLFVRSGISPIFHIPYKNPITLYSFSFYRVYTKNSIHQNIPQKAATSVLWPITPLFGP